MESWDVLLVAGVLALLPVLVGRRGIAVALVATLALLAEAQHLPWTAQGLGLGAILVGVLPRWRWGRPDWRPTPADTAVMLTVITECTQRRWGALLVWLAPPAEMPNTLPGVNLQAQLSAELLLSLLSPLSPLHDGAVVVRNGLVLAAGVILPISTQPLVLGLGTRHRAALGVTEHQPDGLAIVVSEETGQVALAHQGKLLTNLTLHQLREYLERQRNHQRNRL
ncbi:hypothetical protein GlitD10_2398 [Gloeomargarita lithophora Alchichica-D10]|uniref:DAC domain-containing protein n=1 Tax=Gloeomargarita lithophora Alchichica-D10 TaxID=1188229 RepID=A0A1J0AFL7_9CYAN|nr:DNA integrity scanning protein DisA nucleotide-binding domain protein [Gloeomargarita lithophora]APB34732.1 hypothetical protein GlitD10_2398 [Gloeomargarita lithophora Alchichica-D10]